MDEITEVRTEDTIPVEETEIASENGIDRESSELPKTEETQMPQKSDTEELEKPTAETFELKYNHKNVKIDKKEAIRLAQLGMHIERLSKNYSEDIKSVVSDLDYFASVQGKSVKDVVSELINGVEKNYRDELTEQLGKDNPLIDEIIELRALKNRKNYEELKNGRIIDEKQHEEKEQQELTLKFSEQFEKIRKEYPEFTTAADLPETVYKAAFQSGDLEKEILRFKLTQECAVREAKLKEEKNRKENVGSINSEELRKNLFSEMVKGIWSR